MQITQITALYNRIAQKFLPSVYNKLYLTNIFGSRKASVSNIRHTNLGREARLEGYIGQKDFEWVEYCARVARFPCKPPLT